jgi:hypothetical protein
MKLNNLETQKVINSAQHNHYREKSVGAHHFMQLNKN